jgi:hypothetical protein
MTIFDSNSIELSLTVRMLLKTLKRHSRRHCHQLYFQPCFSLTLLAAVLSGSRAAAAETIAGQVARGGAKVEIRFPVTEYFQRIAAEDGNPRPEMGRAVLTFPNGFNPARHWPILIVTSTADFNITSPMDVDLYRRAATDEGWVILAPDATIRPRIDSTQWRLGLLGAALEVLHKDWPQSANWPVAFAGFSGGAKYSGILGAMLAKSGAVRICGFFLSGDNEDRLSTGFRNYHPSRDFLETPIWLNSGAFDRIATPRDHDLVKASLERTGFRRIHLERFDGRHEVKTAQVRLALRWFRELGRF